MSFFFIVLWLISFFYPKNPGYKSWFDQGQIWIQITSGLLMFFCILVPITNWNHPWSWWAALSLIGQALEFWSRYTLGRFYTARLCIQPGQKLIKSGPYRFIKHPGYLGDVLFLMGLCLSYIDIWLILVTGIYFILLTERILIENEMLKVLEDN
jgi:isoprenylcysteine carboxyl methyltransferase (ICMT) family protein YpbQ